MRSSFSWWVPLALSALVFACGDTTDSEEEQDGSESALTELKKGSTKKLDLNNLLEDDDILGGKGITAAQIQGFLDEKGSYLATYSDGGRTAAQIIVDECRANGVSPIYMLARIQGESSLVESKSPNTKNIPKATGCGCPDGKGCSAQYKGFANQITCASKLIKKYFDEMDTKGATVADWKVNGTKKTLDPCTVTPKNRATAALYTYTPWVGSFGDGCGASKYMGSSGIAALAQKYKEALPASQAADDTVAENDKLGAADPSTKAGGDTSADNGDKGDATE
jgi:hypothetical protein